MKKRTLSLMLTAALAAAILAGCGSSDPTANMSDEEKAAWEAAANDPYGKYPETVTYTTGYNLTNQARIPLPALPMKTTLLQTTPTPVI